jgi:pyruvate-formate lyase-activating enzyme
MVGVGLNTVCIWCSNPRTWRSRVSTCSRSCGAVIDGPGALERLARRQTSSQSLSANTQITPP